MTKTFTCRELGGVCDQEFSGDSVMSIMQQAMPHMQSDVAHQEHVATFATTSGESREDWMARMQREFDAKPQDSSAGAQLRALGDGRRGRPLTGGAA